MIASAFKLIPLSDLCKHESAVLHGFDSLPVRYRTELLEHPQDRYSLLYYLLFTHFPELVNDLASEERFYNRYYWLLRFVKQRDARQGYDPEPELDPERIAESAPSSLDTDIVAELHKKVTAEIATNRKEIVVMFSEFSLREVRKRFGLQLDDSGDFFAGTAPVAASPFLKEMLRRYVPLGLAIGNEKARSEFIVAPILGEIREQLSNAVSLFSGTELNVDDAQALRGDCDFLFSLSAKQTEIQAPIVAIVEAKKQDIKAGYGQCLAEMVAARIFNERRNNAVSTIHGVVTTGNIWKFLRLVESTAYIDVSEYYINDVDKILGILLSMFKEYGIKPR